MNTKTIEPYVNKIFKFKIGNAHLIGTFQGIKQHNNTYGMQFTNLYYVNKQLPNTISIFIHPEQTKCTAQDNFLHLRCACRKLFTQHNIAPNIKIFAPTHKIEGPTHV